MDGGTIGQAGERAGVLTGLRRRLVNEYQRGLPVTPQPFGEIAVDLGWNETGVIEALCELVDLGVVSRVGPVIRPNTIGVSALAAMSVPEYRLDAVADFVNRRPEVNHNYQREHRFNLWFVATARDARQLRAVVRQIETASGLAVMVLPMLDDYYINLGFDLDGGGRPRAADDPVNDRGMPGGKVVADEADRRVLQLIQGGLPLVSRPYKAVGALAGLPEQAVCTRLHRLLDAGVIKRLGIVVRHHECGYRHNAMVVWDVPDELVHAAGRRLARFDSVRLCYRRPRCLPQWPYNLFCMIHGRERPAVLDEIARIGAATGLDRFTGDVLFSVRRFKQRGARYDFDAAADGATA